MKNATAFSLIALSLSSLAIGQPKGWKMRVVVTMPPTITKAEVPEAIKAEMRQLRGTQMSDDFVRKNEGAFRKLVENRAKTIWVEGSGLLVFDGNNSSFELPSPVAGSVSVLREVNWYRDGTAINYLSAAGYVQVAGRDTRSRFRLIGEQIAIQHKPIGKAEGSWRDSKGNLWVRYEDVRYGQQPNFAEVRWSQSSPPTALEVRSILKPGAKSFMFSRLRWSGEGKGRVLTFEKFFPDGKLASKVVMSNWREVPSTMDAGLANIPVGRLTMDRRLGEDKPLRYEWPGHLPTLAKLKEMRRTGAALPSYASESSMWLLLVGGGTLVLGAGIFASLRGKRRVRSPLNRANS